MEQFTRDPNQWAPVAVTAIATPLLLPFDHQNSHESVDDHVFGTRTGTGDLLSLGLGLAPIAIGGGDALIEGDTRFFEVSTEAIGWTVITTSILKVAVGRRRPDSASHESFPSGHTSFAFDGATLLARRWADTHDGSPLGYLLYVPATYVGLSRLEGGRHWLSDISFGAALGIFIGNIVYDAHYGDAQHQGIFGARTHVEFGPAVFDEGVGFGVTISF